MLIILVETNFIKMEEHMSNELALTASLEDYLEAIFNIIADKEAVRPKDIARKLKVSNASVTGALRSLAEKDLIHYAPYDVITLTPQGKTIAKDVARRHEVLKDFFMKVLSIEEKIADKAACKMEHSIPKVILERLVSFAEFIELCPRGGSSWIKGFNYYCDQGSSQDHCISCVSSTLEETIEHRKNLKGDEILISKSLKQVKPGQKGKILKITSSSESSKRFLEMGLTPGALVQVERIAPLGDPIDIKVKGYHLSLRKEEAEHILVEVLEQEN
jgi:DtxR family transcriptional regulator, Mn-dependent transcriptional regulator